MPDSPAWLYEKVMVPAVFAPFANVLIDLARPKPGENVLDAACGTGVVARTVARRLGGKGRIVGLDFDPLMLEVARSLAPELEWHQGNLEKPPFGDQSFDLVLCQQGLQFLPDRGAVLREMHRVLRPGGRVTLAIWSDLAKSPGQAALFQALGQSLGKDMSKPPPWSLTDPAEIEALVAAAGFVNVAITTITMSARFPSARRFVETVIEGSSKLTRQLLAQIPADRKTAMIDEVAGQLHGYETAAGLELPHESHLVVGKRGS